MVDDTVSGFGDVTALYERLAEPATLQVGMSALDLAEVSSGQGIIDVAAGTGGLALKAAERGARALATDIVPAMVARAAERLRSFEGCGARVMSCEAIDANDGQFDASFSMFGIVFVPQWREALAELSRVTRSGGRVVISAWMNEGRLTPMGVLGCVFGRTFAGRSLFPRDPLAWTQQKLQGALHDAGCDHVEIASRTGVIVATDIEAFVSESEPFWNMAPGYAALSNAERQRLRPTLVDAFRRDHGSADGSLRMQCPAYIALGKRR